MALIETGCIWLSLRTGSKLALGWMAQRFQRSMGARVDLTMAEATLAEEHGSIRRIIREDVARGKGWEHRRFAAEQIRKTHEERRKTLTGEVAFREKLIERIHDPEVRKEAQESLDRTLYELIVSEFMPVRDGSSAQQAPDRGARVVALRQDA